MKIANIEAIPLAIPYRLGGPSAGFENQDWSRLNILLVKVETANGLVGYGEAFSYNCLRAVQAALEDMIAPVAIGRDARDIRKLMHELQQSLHLFGRYGVTMFALSGLDIALWDIAAKDAGLPLHRLLGAAAAADVPAYASLFRYGNAESVADRCRAALGENYRYIKLHEITEPEVRAARDVVGDDVPLMVDTNCPWTLEQARREVGWLEGYDVQWLEEPIFPPEDFNALARLQSATSIALAAGENACTAFEFEKMFAAGAVRYAQPSVTKVGGITEAMKVTTLASVRGVTVMPHSPYFGPGFLATLHWAAALPAGVLVERIYLQPEASLYGNLIDPRDGMYRVPDSPGIGPDPDSDALRDYRLAEPTSRSQAS